MYRLIVSFSWSQRNLAVVDITWRQISEKQLYQILQKFDILYAEMSDIEKKEFMQLFIDAIELYPEKMDDGRIIRQIDLAFPVYYEGFEGEAIRLLNENTVEVVCLLGRQKPEHSK